MTTAITQDEIDAVFPKVAETMADALGCELEDIKPNVSLIEGLDAESIDFLDMVFRLDFYVGERDLLGIGFSDNVVFRKQYYVRALMDEKPLKLYCLTGEEFTKENGEPAGDLMTATPEGWQFQVSGTGFKGTFQIEIDAVPETGYPQPLSPIK